MAKLKKRKWAPRLQLSLVLILVVFSTAGLLGSSFVVTTLMKHTLQDRVDQDLIASADGWARNPEVYQFEAYVGPPSDFAVLRVPFWDSPEWINAGDTRPNFTDVPIDQGPVTVDSLPDSKENHTWRAIGITTPLGVVVVAKNIAHEQMVISGLRILQGFIALCTAILIALVGWLAIRTALHPLKEVELTASAIAHGDFDRRLPAWPENTEVGKLSKAFNSMLEQLQAAITNSRAKEEQMRRFISDASHELRTPLTSVRGYAELYRSGATDDANRVIAKIEEESGRMKLLVEDLLELNRAEGARLEQQELDLLELLVAARSSAQAANPDRVVDIVDNTTQRPVVFADGNRVHQVFINLIQNAFRHGGEDCQVTITVGDEGREITVDVADNGRGISPDAVEHIFERFYREDSSRSRGQGGGSGLGLSIVRSLVEMHGGTITVTSTLGKGSVFHVRLPRMLNPSNAGR